MLVTSIAAVPSLFALNTTDEVFLHFRLKTTITDKLGLNQLTNGTQRESNST